jgi:hypothetical protein
MKKILIIFAVIIPLVSFWLYVTAFGIYNIIDGVRERQLHGKPPVTGYVINREDIYLFRIGFEERSKFTIEIKGTGEKVQAITDIDLYKKIPDVVSFYYSGDPSRKVFLFEYEQDPLWTGLLEAVGAIVAPFVMVVKLKMRRHLWDGGQGLLHK